MFSTTTNSGDCTRSKNYPASVPTNRSTSGIYWTFTDDYLREEILGSVSVTFPDISVTKSSVSDCASPNSYSSSQTSASNSQWKFSMNCSCGKTVSTMSYFS